MFRMSHVISEYVNSSRPPRCRGLTKHILSVTIRTNPLSYITGIILFLYMIRCTVSFSTPVGCCARRQIYHSIHHEVPIPRIGILMWTY